MRRIYLDNNATTPVLPEVVAAMQPYWTERFGNASAVHEHGRTARAAIDEAREQLASLLNARATEITFTGSGTESDNQALFGTLSAGDHLVTGTMEHHAVLHAAQELEKRSVDVTYIAPTREGVTDPNAVRAAMRPNTRLVSIMLANNETGALQPIQAIAAIAHEGNALLHTDAVQACGKVPVDVRDLGCDLLSLSAHKLHATQGVGAIWVRKGVKLRPLLHGGPHERQRRAGTENVPGIVALGAAAACTAAWLEDNGHRKLEQQHRDFEAELLRRLLEAAIQAQAVPRLPNTTCITFPGVDAEALVIALDLKGLAISGGSACTSGAVEPSHVLTAMGVSEQDARSTVRISMSRLTTDGELRAALDLIGSTVRYLAGLTAPGGNTEAAFVQ